MNRLDFIRTAIAGLALAPTLILAKSDPVATANDIKALSNVKHSVNLRAAGYELVSEHDRCTTIRTVGVSDLFINDVHHGAMDTTPRNYIIPVGRDILVFTGLIESYRKVGQFLEVCFVLTSEAFEISKL